MALPPVAAKGVQSAVVAHPRIGIRLDHRTGREGAVSERGPWSGRCREPRGDLCRLEALRKRFARAGLVRQQGGGRASEQVLVRHGTNCRPRLSVTRTSVTRSAGTSAQRPSTFVPPTRMCATRLSPLTTTALTFGPSRRSTITALRATAKVPAHAVPPGASNSTCAVGPAPGQATNSTRAAGGRGADQTRLTVAVSA